MTTTTAAAAFCRTSWTCSAAATDANDNVLGVKVGDKAEFSKSVSDADIQKFADVTGDNQPLHLDDAYAAKTRFKKRIAHGMLSAGFISAASAQSLRRGDGRLPQPVDALSCARLPRRHRYCPARSDGYRCRKALRYCSTTASTSPARP